MSAAARALARNAAHARAVGCALATLVAAGVVTGLGACGDTAIVLRIESDLVVPDALDAVCLSVAALDAQGDEGTFAARYPLARLPETLTVHTDGYESLLVRARGWHAGLEVAGATVRVDVEAHSVLEASVAVRACQDARPGALAVVGTLPAPAAEAAHVVLHGWRGSVVVVAGADDVTAFSPASDGRVELLPPPPQALAGATALVAIDIDGDCDDDLLALGAPVLLLEHRADGTFVVLADVLPEGLAAVLAAVADVDADGDLDFAVAAGSQLQVLKNDGAGRFAVAPTAIPDNVGNDISALAFGDVTGDGYADLVVGHGLDSNEPMHLLAADPMDGRFSLVPALPENPRKVDGFALADLDGDGDVDLAAVFPVTPLLLFVNRGDGRLEDRSFLRLPDPTLRATSVSSGDLDGDCLPELVVRNIDGGGLTLLRGTASGALLQGELPAGVAGNPIIVDVDGDGLRDLFVAGAGELTWLAPG